MTDVPDLIAHRGQPSLFPENTRSGIQSALDAGACFLEVDVQLTADAVPVLYHDADMFRISGIDRQLSELTFEELADCRVSIPETFGTRFADTPIMSLARFCDWASDWREPFVFVELKLQSLEKFGAGQVVEAVLPHTARLGSNCAIISFDAQALRLVRKLSLHAIGWILPAYSEATLAMAADLQPEYVFCKTVRLPGTDTPLHRGQWLWAVYDINDPDEAVAMGRRGADLVETSHIGKLLGDARLKTRVC